MPAHLTKERPSARVSRCWAYLARAGSERDVLDELQERGKPAILAEGLVLTGERKMRADQTAYEPAFARQAMRTNGRPVTASVEAIADALAETIVAGLPRTPRAWTLQVVAPDARNPRNPRRRVAAAVDEAIAQALDSRLPRAIADAFVDQERAEYLAQVWMVDDRHALVGFTPTLDALTPIAGGRLKMRRAPDAPSRAALKLEEAIAWLGVGPGHGDLCVDLGASPGGWTSVAAARGARVIAVDKRVIPFAAKARRVEEVRASAFHYVPTATADWLLCDVAHRPLDVGKLLAKWGRRVWARQLIANVKLPMKRKADVLAKVVATLEEAGWRGIRARQLFYDRDEVTIFAWLDPKIAGRGYRPPPPVDTFAHARPTRKRARDRS